MATEATTRSESVNDFAAKWFAKRAAQGVVMACDERRNIEQHVLPAIGKMMLCDVRRPHIRAIIDALPLKTYNKGVGSDTERHYKRETITKVRGAVFRMFRAAHEDDLIELTESGG